MTHTRTTSKGVHVFKPFGGGVKKRRGRGSKKRIPTVAEITRQTLKVIRADIKTNKAARGKKWTQAQLESHWRKVMSRPAKRSKRSKLDATGMPAKWGNARFKFNMKTGAVKRSEDPAHGARRSTVRGGKLVFMTKKEIAAQDRLIRARGRRLDREDRGGMTHAEWKQNRAYEDMDAEDGPLQDFDDERAEEIAYRKMRANAMEHDRMDRVAFHRFWKNGGRRTKVKRRRMLTQPSPREMARIKRQTRSRRGEPLS